MEHFCVFVQKEIYIDLEINIVLYDVRVVCDVGEVGNLYCDVILAVSQCE
jgi:hypothetical protein